MIYVNCTLKCCIWLELSRKEFNRNSTIAFYYEKNKSKIIIIYFLRSYAIAMILIFLGPKSP